MLQRPPIVAAALDLAEAGMDIADALHISACGECLAFLTFDKDLARSARRGHSVPVELL